MDFGSDFILMEDEEEEQEEASDRIQEMPVTNYEDNSGYECEIMEFDDEDEEYDTQTQIKKMNTNTVKLEMKKLKEKPDIMVSKLVTCQIASCGAVYSHLAKKDLDKKIWICNFCGQINKFDGELPDLSDKSDVMYLEDINNPPELQPQESSKQKIIFVIDKSASMSQTNPMPLSKASQTLKRIFTKDQEKLQQQLAYMLQPGQDPMMLQIGQNPNIIEVTRLQSIKASAIEVIERLSLTEQSQMHVGLVAFDENVTVYGDGSTEITVEGGQLADINELHRIGARYANLKPVEESSVSLTKKIEMLDDQGQTALGPALVIAQRMASDAAGSKVILCTDGFANIGLGKLEKTTEEEINQFYSDVIAESIKLGVSISIICVDNAGLNTKLGQVPTETGGNLEKIHATDMSEKLILEDLKRATAAVDAYTKFIVHKDLYVNDTKEPDAKCSQYNKIIGNLQLDQQMSFSFAFKPSNPQQQEQPPSQPQAGEDEQPKTCDQFLPFQVQIKYTTFSGVQVVRVWTAERKMTRNRSQAEDAMNSKTVVANFIQQSSQQLLNSNSRSENVRKMAAELKESGNDYLAKLTLDHQTEKILADFISLISKIAQQGSIDEDHYAKLNKLQEARLCQVQG